MKNNLLALLLILLCYYSHGQTAQVKYTELIPGNKKVGNFDEILGENSKYVYIKIKKGSGEDKMVRVIAYDKGTMKEAANRIIYDVKDTLSHFLKNSYYETLVLENRIYIVWLKKNNQGGKDIYVSSFDNLIKPINKPTLLYSSPENKGEGTIEYGAWSNSTLNQLVVAKITNLNDQNIIIDYNFVDTNFNSIAVHKSELNIPSGNTVEGAHEFQLGNDGNLHIKYGVKVLKDEPHEKKYKEECIYAVMNLKEGLLKIIPFEFENKSIFNFNYTADKNAIKLFGLFSDLTKDPKGSKIHGCFYALVDPITLKVKNDFKFDYFTPSQLDLFQKDESIFNSSKEKKAKEESASPEYRIEQVKSVNDDIFVFLTKVQSHSTSQSYTNSSGMSTTSYSNYCVKTDVIAIKIENDGNIQWAKSVNRRDTYNGIDIYDLKAIYNKDKIYVFYGAPKYAVFDCNTGEYETSAYTEEPKEDKYRKKIQSEYYVNLDNGLYFYTKIYLSNWGNSKQLIKVGRVSFN